MHKKKLNKKHWFLIAGGVLLAVGGFAIYSIFFPKHTQIVSGDISTRAKEFVTNQQKDDTSVWREQNFDKKNEVFESKQVGTMYATECFTVAFPFETTGTKTEAENGMCTVRTRTVSPSSQLVISTQKLTEKLDEHSSILLRRRETEKYHEKEFILEGYDQNLQFIEEDTVTIFLTKKDILVTVAFSTLSQPERLTDKTIRELIERIVIVE